MDSWIPVFVATISAVSTIIITIIQVKMSRRQKTDDEERAKRQEDVDARSERQERLLLQLLRNANINGELAHATALAVKRGEVNGEMENALENYEDLRTEIQYDSARAQAAGFNQVQTVKIVESGKNNWIKAVLIGICFIAGLAALNQILDYITKVWFT